MSQQEETVESPKSIQWNDYQFTAPKPEPEHKAPSSDPSPSSPAWWSTVCFPALSAERMRYNNKVSSVWTNGKKLVKCEFETIRTYTTDMVDLGWILWYSEVSSFGRRTNGAGGHCPAHDQAAIQRLQTKSFRTVSKAVWQSLSIMDEADAIGWREIDHIQSITSDIEHDIKTFGFALRKEKDVALPADAKHTKRLPCYHRLHVYVHETGVESSQRRTFFALGLEIEATLGSATLLVKDAEMVSGLCLADASKHCKHAECFLSVHVLRRQSHATTRHVGRSGTRQGQCLAENHHTQGRR